MGVQPEAMAYQQSNVEEMSKWPDINPNNSGITPQMPLVVVMGVDAVGQLPPAAEPSAEAQQYAPHRSQHSICTLPRLTSTYTGAQRCCVSRRMRRLGYT